VQVGRPKCVGRTNRLWKQKPRCTRSAECGRRRFPSLTRARVVMTDAEWGACRNAGIRALRAVGDITDETDTDEIWDEVFRGLKEAR
jgi:hypothetical protein